MKEDIDIPSVVSIEKVDSNNVLITSLVIIDTHVFNDQDGGQVYMHDKDLKLRHLKFDYEDDLDLFVSSMQKQRLDLCNNGG